MNFNRRDFFKVAGLSATAGVLGKTIPALAGTGNSKLNLGMASYTFRKFSLDDAIKMTKRVEIKHIALKSMHMPLDAPLEETKKTAAKVRAAGLDLYGAGVIYMRNEQQVNQAFEYAKAAGLRVIIGVPERQYLNMVNQKVKQYDIKVAIHNHGPGDQHFPGPQDVYDSIKNLDKRIGLCIDIGHTTRLGLDPSVEAKKYFNRLYDIHIKDVSAAKKEGKTVELGRGVIDIPKFLKTLISLNYQGMVSLEYEKDAADPLPGAAESVGYEKGVLAVI